MATYRGDDRGSDASLRARLRENGLRAAATRFDWSVISGAHEAEFRNML